MNQYALGQNRTEDTQTMEEEEILWKKMKKV